jgi:hypothetical protein
MQPRSSWHFASGGVWAVWVCNLATRDIDPGYRYSLATRGIVVCSLASSWLSRRERCAAVIVI